MWSPNTPCSCERVISLARGPWRTFDCRYEHEPQISLHKVLLPTTSLQLTEVKGADYFERRHDPAVEAKRLARRIEALGFDVSLIEKAA